MCEDRWTEKQIPRAQNRALLMTSLESQHYAPKESVSRPE